MVITILADLQDYLNVIEEQKREWLYTLLHFLELDVVHLDKLPSDLAAEYLIENHVYITDYPSIGALQVEYRKDSQSSLEVIGEWAGPEYHLKTDDKGKLYYEISIECWSVLDESIDME